MSEIERSEYLLNLLDGLYDDDNILTSPNMRCADEFEQAVCAAVCQFTKMTPEGWQQLQLPQQRLPWIEVAIEEATRRCKAPHSPSPLQEQGGRTGDFDPAKIFAKEERIEELKRQLKYDEAEVLARRTPVATAMNVVLALFPNHEGQYALSEERCPELADALLTLCRVARDHAFGRGIDDIVSIDPSQRPDHVRIGIHLFCLASEEKRDELIGLLRQCSALKKYPDGPNPDTSLCQRWLWMDASALLAYLIPQPWNMPLYHPWAIAPEVNERLREWRDHSRSTWGDQESRATQPAAKDAVPDMGHEAPIASGEPVPVGQPECSGRFVPPLKLDLFSIFQAAAKFALAIWAHRPLDVFRDVDPFDVVEYGVWGSAAYELSVALKRPDYNVSDWRDAVAQASYSPEMQKALEGLYRTYDLQKADGHTGSCRGGALRDAFARLHRGLRALRQGLSTTEQNEVAELIREIDNLWGWEEVFRDPAAQMPTTRIGQDTRVSGRRADGRLRSSERRA